MVEESDSDNDDDDNNDESTNRKGCVVCFGRKSVEKLKKSTGNCKHERDICRKCFNSHVKARLDDKGDVNINCPTLNCKELVYPDDVKRFGYNKLCERFVLFLFKGIFFF